MDAAEVVRHRSVRDEHEPAAGDASQPRILHRHRVRVFGGERRGPRRGIEPIGSVGLEEIDAPSTAPPIDVAHVEPPTIVLAHDRAPLDRRAREVVARRTPDRYERRAVAARDHELGAADRSWPAEPVHEVDDISVGVGPGSAGPVAESGAWRRDEQGAARGVDWWSHE